MELDARKTADLYQSLVHALGETNANTFMTLYPPQNHDELVTKAHLRAELAELRLSGLRQTSALAGLIVATASALGLWG